jgi:hypothetical protein
LDKVGRSRGGLGKVCHCVGPKHRPNWYAPYTFEDGRIYDVLDLDICEADVCEGTDGGGRLCRLEVMGRGEDYSHLFFHFRYHSSIFHISAFETFEDDGCSPANETDSERLLLAISRSWVWRYLDEHRQMLPCSRWTKPTGRSR